MLHLHLWSDIQVWVNGCTRYVWTLPWMRKKEKSKKKADMPLVEFMYLVFTRMPGEIYRRRLRSFLFPCVTAFGALINSLACWFFSSLDESRRVLAGKQQTPQLQVSCDKNSDLNDRLCFLTNDFSLLKPSRVSGRCIWKISRLNQPISVHSISRIHSPELPSKRSKTACRELHSTSCRVLTRMNSASHWASLTQTSESLSMATIQGSNRYGRDLA